MTTGISASTSGPRQTRGSHLPEQDDNGSSHADLGKIRFVDAHHHLYDLEQNYYAWLSDNPPPPWIYGDNAAIRKTYLVKDYLAQVDGFNVVKSVHVEVGWDPQNPAGETAWLQNVADQAGFPHGIVGHARLERADIDSVLEQHCRAANFRGIRQNLNWHDDPSKQMTDRPDHLGDTAWRRGFALLRERDLSFDLQIFHPQMDDAYALAKTFDDTRIILNHGGMLLERDAASITAWTADLKHLARAPNVAVKISGLGLGFPGWTTADIRPLVLTLIDLFGPDRCMFATDLPVDALFADTAAIFNAFIDICSSFSPSEQNAMFAGTAEQWYRI